MPGTASRRRGHLLLPWETLRLAADLLGIWGLVWMLGLASSYRVHPHAVRARSRDTSKAVQVDRSERAVMLNVVMGSQTNVDVRLRRPLVVAVRRGEEPVTELRLYADDPRALVAAAREHLAPVTQPRRSST